MNARDDVVVLVPPVAQGPGVEGGLGVGQGRRGRRSPAGEGDGHLERGQRGPAVAARPGRRGGRGRRRRPWRPRPSRPRSSSVRRRRRRRAARAGTACDRQSSGAFTSKYGFSVVAPMRVSMPVLDAGQQRVLLRLVEAVHLVEEQDRALAVLAQPPPGPLDHLAHVLHARRSPPTAARRPRRWRRRSGGRASSCPCPAAPRGSPTTAGRPRSAPAAACPAPSRCSWPTTSSRVRGPQPVGQRRPRAPAAPRPPTANRSSATAPIRPVPAAPGDSGGQSGLDDAEAELVELALGRPASGAPVSGSTPDWVFGKAMTSRMLSSPARMATRRSMPKAKPAWGGAP